MRTHLTNANNAISEKFGLPYACQVTIEMLSLGKNTAVPSMLLSEVVGSTRPEMNTPIIRRTTQPMCRSTVVN